jgi:hypothetical protein
MIKFPLGKSLLPLLPQNRMTQLKVNPVEKQEKLSQLTQINQVRLAQLGITLDLMQYQTTTKHVNQKLDKHEQHKPTPLDYNVIEDMKKTKANISMFDICSLPQQCELLNDAFNPNDAHKRMVVVTDNTLPEDEVQ